MIKFWTSLVVLLCTNLIIGCTSLNNNTGLENYKSYGEQIEDSKIINFIKQKFSSDPLIPHKLVHVAIDRGIVQLSGFIQNRQDADLIVSVTKSIPGVRDVIDNLVVLSSHDYANRRAIVEKYNTPR